MTQPPASVNVKKNLWVEKSEKSSNPQKERVVLFNRVDACRFKPPSLSLTFPILERGKMEVSVSRELPMFSPTILLSNYATFTVLGHTISECVKFVLKLSRPRLVAFKL